MSDFYIIKTGKGEELRSSFCIEEMSADLLLKCYYFAKRNDMQATMREFEDELIRRSEFPYMSYDDLMNPTE